MKRAKADEFLTVTKEHQQQIHEIKLLLDPSSKEVGIMKKSTINNSNEKVISQLLNIQ